MNYHLNKLLCLVLLICVISVNTGERSFKIEGNKFLKDGKEFRYISGEIHYNRIHPSYWNDRLSRIKAAGLNAIQIYVPWNLHEPYEGTYDFDGIADVVKFIQLAQNHSLLVLLRPGPYICAEWENGGLPYWLLKYQQIQLRKYNDPYISAIQKWYTKLFSILMPYLYKNGGPIIMIQVENEYGSQGSCDKKYTLFLRNLVRSLIGNDTVLYTVDSAQKIFFECGTIEDVFSTIDFGPTTSEKIISNFQLQQEYAKGLPIVNTEFYPGWFTTWGDYNTKIPSLNESISSMDVMWKNNASFSIYMMHGGTNFGFTSGAEIYAPLITSYDYSAPISENGDITDLYQAISSWINTLDNYDSKPLSTPFNIPSTNYGKINLQPLKSNFIDGIKLAINDSRCVTSDDPKSFEELDQPYGFVLYSAMISADGNKLSCLRARDNVYVYLNNDYRGVMMQDFYLLSNMTMDINAKKGDQLYLLVENRGRQNYPAVVDKKGLFADIKLDKTILKNWSSCPIDLDSLNFLEMPQMRFNQKDASNPPLIWRGTFQVNDVRARDTYLNPSKFLKGVVYINGFNLGRYWTSAGPQITLYVPAPILFSGKNNITVVDLMGATTSQVELVSRPIYRQKDIL